MNQDYLNKIQKGIAWAIIPARAGSKGVIDKNIRDLKGHPLIAHTIAVCNLASEVQRTIVSTDSEKYADTFVVCKDLFEKCVTDIDGKYMFAVGNMPSKRADIEEMVSYCYRTDSDIRYELQNPVTYELSIISIILKLVSKAFFYVGIFFALFAALMLANFIGTSISYKKQEIGILRAIGSRSNDVFRIFFSESFIIAMINFVLSISGVFVVTNAINLLIREEFGILVTVLHCGIRQVVLLFVVSVVVAFVASFLPVRKIAAKKPIDAIRKR